MASPYEVLGVEHDADRESVESAYRERVKETHPDAGGSAEDFKRVKEAYRAIVEEGTGHRYTTGDTSSSTASESTGSDDDDGDESDRNRDGKAYTGRGRRSRGQSTAGSETEANGSTAGSNRSGSTSNRTGTGTGGSKTRSNGTGTGTSGAGTSGARTNSKRSGSGASRATTGGNRAGSRSNQYGHGSAGSGANRSDNNSSSTVEEAAIPRRWYLYGLSSIVGAGALANHDDLRRTAPARAIGLGLSDRGETVGRTVAPGELFPVDVWATRGSTMQVTVQGADTRDWINVYPEYEYQRVAENWDGSGEFDPGNPLQTVLTEDGYLCEIPADGAYVILVTLWSGPPDDPRDPRRVEISYQIR